MQSRRGSCAEVATNIFIGYIIACLTQAVVFPMFGIHIPAHDHLLIGLLFTVVSIIRSYVLRRVFNKYNFFGR